MKKIQCILILLFPILLNAQNFNIKGGTVVNKGGVIEINGARRLNNQTGLIENSGTITLRDAIMNSNGLIENVSGQILINSRGSHTFTQQSIDGYVEYNHQDPQLIPMISYDSVNFVGGNKLLSTDNNVNSKTLEARNLFSSKKNSRLVYNESGVEIHSHQQTEHDGIVEGPNTFQKVFKQNGDSLKAMLNGTGIFTHLELDNSNGATITRGGFTVNQRLTLRDGVLYNSNDENFIMKDGSVIEIVNGNFDMEDQSAIYKYAEGTLNQNPNFNGTIAILYTGDNPNLSSGEIPIDKDVLTDLDVESVGGVTLASNAYVNNRIRLTQDIRTYQDLDGDDIAETEHIIYLYNPDNSLEFENQQAQIDGDLARTNLSSGSDIKLNNEYTYLRFEPEGQDLLVDGGQVDTIISRTRAGEVYDILEYPHNATNELAYRKIKLTALDNQGQEITELDSARYGFAWRHYAVGQVGNDSETPGIAEFDPESVLLNRWDAENETWVSEPESFQPASFDQDNNWGYSYAVLEGPIGEFGIGMEAAQFLRMIAKTFMEGPYRGGDTMSTDLNQLGLIDSIPPDEYPYNLDPNRGSIVATSIPEDVVDWIVLELRNDPINSTQSFYKTCFIKSNGTLIDIDGNTEIRIDGETTGADVTARTNYYVAIRHRNHLAVVTKDPFVFNPEDGEPFDFSDPTVLLAPLKVLGFDSNGDRIFGMFAGNVERNQLGLLNEQEINNADYQEIWNNIGFLGYLRADVDMNGLVTTRDYNMSWNNRSQFSEVLITE